MADIISDEYKVIDHRRQMVCKWLLADDRIVKSWDGTRIAGIDKARPRTEIIIRPLNIDIDEELDPYIAKNIAKESSLFQNGG